jgi:hypothetical protein
MPAPGGHVEACLYVGLLLRPAPPMFVSERLHIPIRCRFREVSVTMKRDGTTFMGEGRRALGMLF